MSDARFFNIGLPQLPLNLNKEIEPDLRDVYNALRTITYLLGQYGGFEAPESAYHNDAGTEYTAGYYKRRIYRVCMEAISYGAMVTVDNVGGGGYGAWNANATNSTRPCHGICNTVGGGGVGATIEIVLPSCYVTSIGGMTPGTRYFLSTVNGIITNVAPAAVGNIHQAIGIALAANILFFHPNYDWTIV